MAPTVDLFYLTFNAAKHLISIPAFGHHLHNALKENATTLPELVVFSLQEMAPISSAFIGAYFLDPYFARYETALNLAAAQFVSAGDDGVHPRAAGSKQKAYTLVRTGNVGMTGIMLFARDPASVRVVQTAEVGFGARDMANKGAVGFRVVYTKEGKETEMTFVATHLEAMEWNLEYRNHNWESIVTGLLFENPKQILDQGEVTRAREASTQSGETQSLLFRPETEKALHQISIYKPGTHLFVAGDLNYRLSNTSPPDDATFPVVSDPQSQDYYPRFLSRDQLTAEKAAGRTLHGLSEALIGFPPTYKYRVLPSNEPRSDLNRIGVEEDDHEDVKWKFARHRWPGWCDRVLYLEVPPWAPHANSGSSRGAGGKPEKINVTAYDCLPVVRTSDHRAVFLRAQVPVLSHEELAPTVEASTTTGRGDDQDDELLRRWGMSKEEHGGIVDPRVKLPFAVNVDAWEHRAAVKRWEYLIGWSMKLSASRQGIMVFVTVFLVGLGAWWFGSWSS